MTLLINIQSNFVKELGFILKNVIIYDSALANVFFLEGGTPWVS